jgi:hypothetical protein
MRLFVSRKAAFVFWLTTTIRISIFLAIVLVAYALVFLIDKTYSLSTSSGRLAWIILVILTFRLLLPPIDSFSKSVSESWIDSYLARRSSGENP